MPGLTWPVYPGLITAPFWAVFSSEKWCKANEMPTPEIPVSEDHSSCCAPGTVKLETLHPDLPGTCWDLAWLRGVGEAEMVRTG